MKYFFWNKLINIIISHVISRENIQVLISSLSIQNLSNTPTFGGINNSNFGHFKVNTQLIISGMIISIDSKFKSLF